MSEDFFPDLPIEEQEQGIFFSNQEIEMPDFDQQKTAVWINIIAEQNNCQIGTIQYIFCSDDYLHKINVDFLDHDTFTDIITFPYSEAPLISSDIYISIDRIEENARERSILFEQELRRVIIHGILHLCGFGDKTDVEANKMRQLEEAALTTFKESFV